MKRILMIAAALTVVALMIGAGESTRHVCPDCGRAMHPIPGHETNVECPRCGTGLQTDYVAPDHR